MRKICACPFCPRGLCVRARSKDAALLLLSLHPPLVSVTHRRTFSALPLLLSRSLACSFFSLASLYFCIRRLQRPCVSSASYPSAPFLTASYGIATVCGRVYVTFISGCDDNLRRCINKVFSLLEMLCAMRGSAVEHRCHWRT